VDGRSRRRLPTIFTSNHNFNEIANRLSDAVASRLYALTKERQVWCEAEDWWLRAGTWPGQGQIESRLIPLLFVRSKEQMNFIIWALA
jgi:hypothetical protein